MEIETLGISELTSSIPGMEFLVNTKTTSTPKRSMSSQDVDNLEQELNSLSSSINKTDLLKPDTDPPRVPRTERKEFPRTEIPRTEIPRTEFPRTEFPRTEKKEISISNDDLQFDHLSTAPFPESKPSWDGFKAPPPSALPEPSKADSLRQRFEYLRKLEALAEKGAPVSRKYTIDSTLDDMKTEYEYLISEKERSNNVKFMGGMLQSFVTTAEFLNSKFDPFDIKLDGFSDQVKENISDYDDIFAAINDIYAGSVTIRPELRLVFQLATSAMMVHMTNTLCASSMPGLGDIMRQNPDLMKEFQNAAVQSVGAVHPGMATFMNTHKRPEKRSEPEKPRPDMKGPSDISNILNGLKAKPPEDENINEMRHSLEKRPKKQSKTNKNSVAVDF